MFVSTEPAPRARFSTAVEQEDQGMARLHVKRAIGVMLAVAALATACGDNKSSSTTSTTVGGSSTSGAVATTAAAPVKGGVITIGQYSRENGLDPTKLNGGGTVGGSELAALYYTL